MDGEHFDRLLTRIDSAIARVEGALAEKPGNGARAPGEPDLFTSTRSAREDRLRAALSSAIDRIDTLLAAGGSPAGPGVSPETREDTTPELSPQ